MKHFKTIYTSMFIAVVLGAAGPATAQWRPATFFVEGAGGEKDLGALTVGVGWPWDWKRDWLGGQFGGSTEAFVTHIRARGPGGGHEGTTLLGVQPLLRYRFAEGRSPWFLEAGIGLSVTDSKFETTDKRFSTNFNFYDTLAAGRSFGEGGRHEVSLRLTHISNGGVKKPNPGEEFLQLRYAAKF